jgi:hypothetical protein
LLPISYKDGTLIAEMSQYFDQDLSMQLIIPSNFNLIGFIVDLPVHSKHGLLIRCDIWPRFVKRSSDVKNGIIPAKSSRGGPPGPIHKHSLILLRLRDRVFEMYFNIQMIQGYAMMRFLNLYWMSEFEQYWLSLAQNEAKKFVWTFNPLFKERRLSIDKTCINKVYGESNYASNSKKMFWITVNL